MINIKDCIVTSDLTPIRSRRCKVPAEIQTKFSTQDHHPRPIQEKFSIRISKGQIQPVDEVIELVENQFDNVVREREGRTGGEVVARCI